MIIKRTIYNTYHVVDEVYSNEGKLLFEQGNLLSKNRFGAKKFKCNNGKIFTNITWIR